MMRNCPLARARGGQAACPPERLLHMLSGVFPMGPSAGRRCDLLWSPLVVGVLLLRLGVGRAGGPGGCLKGEGEVLGGGQTREWKRQE